MKNKITSATRCLLFTFMCFMSFVANAQTETSLFTPILLPSKLTEEQATMVEKIRNYPTAKAVQYVTVNNYAKFVEDKYLTFTIPNQEEVIKAKIKRSELSENGDYVCYAVFENHFGEILLVKQGDKIFGTLSYEDNSYRIIGVRKNLSALMTVSNVNPQNECGSDNSRELPHAPTSAPSNTPGIISPCNTSPLTSILFLFTPAAAAVEPDINQIALLGTVNFNNALSNSAVSSQAARIKMVGLAALDFAEADFRDDIVLLPNIAAARALRNRFRADVVVLLTNGSYGGVFGIVNQINAEEPNAYAIVQVTAAIADKQWTFTHELGHLFGGRHQQDEDPDIGSAHGKAFDVRYGLFNLGRKRFHTIMHRLTDGRDRILHFSNPGVNFRGVSTGDASCCNVASAITQRAPTMASFRAEPNTLSSGIIGTETIYQNGSYSWEPSIGCGVGPYTTQWEIILPNGQNIYNQTVANDGLLNLYAYIPSTLSRFGFFTIRMTVRSSDNQTSVSFLNVQIGADLPLIRPIDNPQIYNIQNRSEGDDIQSVSNISPNPATSKVNLDFILNREAEVHISVFDSQGKEVKSLPLTTKTKGYNTLGIDVSNLSSGIYLCRIATNNSIATQKFLVNH